MVDIPGTHRARLERDDPRVAAVDTLDLRRAHEAVDAVGEDERRGRRPVVAERVPEDWALGRPVLLVLGGCDEVAEEHGRPQHGGSDLDEAEALDVGDPAGSAQPDDLAVLRDAPARKAPRAERHPVGQAVDGAKPEVRPRDRALAEEHQARRIAAHDARECPSGTAVELSVVIGLVRDAEPVGAHRPLRCRNVVEGLPDPLVPGHDRAREDGGEHRRPRRHARGSQEGGGRAAREPHPGEAERVGEPADCAHVSMLPARALLDHAGPFSGG